MPRRPAGQRDDSRNRHRARAVKSTCRDPSRTAGPSPSAPPPTTPPRASPSVAESLAGLVDRLICAELEREGMTAPPEYIRPSRVAPVDMPAQHMEF